MSVETARKREKPAWIQIVKRYQTPSIPKSVIQILNSFVPYFLIWYLMYRSLEVSYALTILLAFTAVGFLTRIFIIQHDCGHQSFFKSRVANDRLGAFAGVLTLTPYHHWRTMHARHHATSGDLDFRGFGDVDTLTVDEYLARDWKGRLQYRIFRSPIMMFVISPSILFLIAHRWHFGTKPAEKKARASVWKTNAAILGAVLGLGYFIGVKEVLMVQLPITIITSSIGVFLFYVQHQFEDTYWRWHREWDYKTAALEGASYFKLPKLLQWLTGNIGYHHVHHLSPLIPNYLLEQAHEENEIFHEVETLTLKSSLRTIFLHLWDEDANRLISFRELRKKRARAAA
ncbi:MAG: fatty acid desaturase [Anaerolineae bacterium]|nr:fatty acid desaturase [Anaerolineae bacterium]